MATPIYVIGSSNTDMVVQATRLPLPGETILGGNFLMNPGGKGANQAVAAARLGGQVTLVTRVGNDVFGKQAVEQFTRENINTRFISIDEQHPSGVALINVDEQGENSITVAPGANGRITPETIQAFLQELKNPALVLIQLEIPISTVEYVIENCHEKNIPVILNPAPANSIASQAYKNLFAITPNETEAEILTGIAVTNDETAKQAAQHLHNKGVKNIIITLGKRGAYWSNGQSDGFVSAPIVKAIDSTAAGDCFNGALAVAIAERINLPEAVALACRAASISVTRLGAQASMPFKHELN